MATRYDAIVIGTGQSGPALAGRMSDAGMKVAVIERKLFGGTCVNTGCIPTKTLVASARTAHVASRAADYGVMIEGAISVDMKKVKARKDGISGASNKGVESWLKGMENVTVFEGHGRFESPDTVIVNGQTLEADKIFINVGGRAFVPPMPDGEGLPYLTNSGMMEIDFLPEHLVIIGGSYVGLEFGQMYRRFGSEVTIIEKGPRLIGREDEDVSDTVREIMEKEGINLRLNAECINAKKHDRGVEVEVDCTHGDPSVIGTHLLWAVGRVPNTDDLGLEKARIETNERGYIQVDDQLETN
ncbi:MAG: mercuric reductase, partial [Candidatus Dadabacteria bacterium]|nr:mercuric reductase [Candidatus Dadabacteria bacterium]